MKSIKKLLYTTICGLLLIGCSDDETYKDLLHQAFLYPIVENDGVVERLTELAYDESPRVITMRIALHPRQNSATDITYEFQSIDDPDVNSATEGVDFEALSPKTVTIPANEDFVDVSFQILNDQEEEDNEDFIFYITDASGLSLLEGSRQYRFTIRGNDEPQTVNLEDLEESTFMEGSDFEIEGSLSGALDSDITLTVAVSGTATDGVDYTLDPKEVTVPAGETSFTFPVSISTDAVLEYDETLTVTLSSVDGNATIGDDNELSVDIQDASLSVPDEGDLAFGLVWADLANTNLDFHLNYKDGMDTVTVATSNSTTDFEDLLLEGTDDSGTYYIVVDYVSGSEETEYIAFVNDSSGEIERVTGTISEGMEYILTITKENSFTLE